MKFFRIPLQALFRPEVQGLFGEDPDKKPMRLKITLHRKPTIFVRKQGHTGLHEYFS